MIAYSMVCLPIFVVVEEDESSGEGYEQLRVTSRRTFEFLSDNNAVSSGRAFSKFDDESEDAHSPGRCTLCHLTLSYVRRRTGYPRSKVD